MIADRYELEELAGSGGMSAVYRARDALLDRKVALKILHEHYTDDEEYVERFRREARAVAQLSHPNIVTVIDRGEDDGRQYIVFEYIEGRTLKDLLDETGRLPVRRALEVSIEVAHGLGFAHEHGLVHRDVKPQNVLLNGDGQAKVTDFGIAHSLDVVGLTQSGMVLGTSNYIAPEQASGMPVDACTDVYSLGVVLFELLTGRVPFPGEAFVAVAMKHVHEPPPSVLELRPDVPVRVAAAVDRALAKDPGDRFASMPDFGAELEACLAAMGGDAGDDSTLIGHRPVARAGGRYQRRARRRPSPLAAGLVALLVAAAIAAGLLLGRDDTPPTAGASKGALVKLRGSAAFDPPPGDGREHDAQAASATDGNPASYWSTEHYSSFSKPGVGLVLDAGSSERLTRIRVTTDTPGFTAQIRSGTSEEGPFAAVSPARSVSRSTTFSLSGKPARYYVVWITNLPQGVAHVNEATGVR